MQLIHTNIYVQVTEFQLKSIKLFCNTDSVQNEKLY